MRKGLAAALISILACLPLLITIGSSEVSAYPSTPEFSVKLVAYPYDVPPQTTTTIDQYTGEEKVTTQPGYNVENKSIQLIIRTQPFTPFRTQDDANWSVNFYYNIRYKGHFSEEWQYCYSASDGYLPQGSGIDLGNGYFVYTFYRTVSLEPNAQIDFQVEAMIGYTHRVVEGGMAPWRFTGETSGWSSTQTLTINENENAPTSNSSNEQTLTSSTENVTNLTGNVQQVAQDNIMFGLEWKDLAIGFVTAIITVLVLMLIFRKKEKTTEIN